MKNVISIAGYSNSGKTTLIKKLIPEFKKRGYSVCVIKHIHGALKLDQKGKDTYKFTKAGADTVLMQNKNTLAMVKKVRACHGMPIKEIIKKYAKNYDLVMVEGFKKANLPQIWVYSADADVKTGGKKIIAGYGKKAPVLNKPVFGKGDFKAIADFIEERIIKLTR